MNEGTNVNTKPQKVDQQECQQQLQERLQAVTDVNGDYVVGITGVCKL